MPVAMNTADWAILTFRYGRDVRNPTPHDIAEAVAELSNENIPGMQEGDYAEHPNAWLRLGSDDGPVYVVDAYCNGQVILSKYADQDDIDAASEVTLTNVPKEKLLAMWTWLAENDLARFRTEWPECDW
jgi:hypothetical protein